MICKPVWLSCINWPLQFWKADSSVSTHLTLHFSCLKCLTMTDQLFLWPIYLAKSLFARPFVVLFFFLMPSISKPPTQPVCSLVLGLFFVPLCSDSHPVIVLPSSPPCEPRSFAWLTQTSFGTLFSDMNFFGAALLAGKCNSAHPIVFSVSSLSLSPLLFLSISVPFSNPHL